jgi:hypothetical protein
LRGVPDDQVLAEAAREGRILLSHDHRTIPRHFATFMTLQLTFRTPLASTHTFFRSRFLRIGM